MWKIICHFAHALGQVANDSRYSNRYILGQEKEVVLQATDIACSVDDVC